MEAAERWAAAEGGEVAGAQKEEVAVVVVVEHPSWCRWTAVSLRQPARPLAGTDKDSTLAGTAGRGEMAGTAHSPGRAGMADRAGTVGWTFLQLLVVWGRNRSAPSAGTAGRRRTVGFLFLGYRAGGVFMLCDAAFRGAVLRVLVP